MFTIMGTLPFDEMGLRAGKATFEGGHLKVEDFEVTPSLGTSVMVASACITCEALNLEPPYFVTAGDIGDGKRSKELYQYVAANMAMLDITVLAMHYIMPDIPGIRNILNSPGKRRKGMTMIADAGAMYAAKAAGLAQEIDIFTPDAGEMAYLADPKATHPAYVEHLLFKLDASEVLTLIKKSYESGNTPKILLVKGPVDYVVKEGEVVETINEPSISAMEAIGGTGDSLTGILSALIYGGYEKVDACIKAAGINRIAGKLAQPDPATSISHIIAKIPDALKEVGLCA
ncbi:MAG: NAD(P)H-hydrate dehydratase [Thermodesulfobacteriota bacterium]|nr:NAD(P)H-hydrate dehydratase [Thermodesulfobacteriota bacterium]